MFNTTPGDNKALELWPLVFKKEEFLALACVTVAALEEAGEPLVARHLRFSRRGALATPAAALTPHLSGLHWSASPLNL